MKHNIFLGAFSTAIKSQISIESIVELLKSDAMKHKIEKYRSLSGFERKRFKNTLPCFQYGGSFTGRSMHDIIDASGFMILDWDDYSAPHVLDFIEQHQTSIAEFRNRFIAELKQNPSILFAFVSPSGGIKYLIKTDCFSKQNDHYKIAYEYVRQQHMNDLSKALDIKIELDTATKDISRLCFLSYDKDVYFNPECTTLSIIEDVKDCIERNDKEQQRLIRKAERDRKAIEQRGLSIDEEKQEHFKQSAINFYLEKSNFKGQRHQGIFTLCMQLYSLEYNINQVTQVLEQLKRTSAYTEELTPRNKALDIFKTYQLKPQPNMKIYITNPKGLFL